MSRALLLISAVLGFGCTSTSDAPLLDECTAGTCDESSEATVLGRPAREYFNGLTYARRDGVLSHRLLRQDRLIDLEPDGLRAELRLYLVPGPRYILEYREVEGTFRDEVDFVRLEGDVSLDETILLFDGGELATATGKDFGGLDGIAIDFAYDILSAGLAGRPVGMVLTLSNYGLPECMDDPDVTQPCPVD